MALILASQHNLQAASGTWDGLTDATWAGANWGGATPVPGLGDTATFNNAGNGNTTINLGAGVTVSNVVFDTGSVAAYSIGSGVAGSQTLTLQTNSVITLNPGVANNQVINALISIPSETNAAVTIGNSSANLLTLAGGITSIPTNGNSLLTITNIGDVNLTGVVTETGTGNLALLKTGSGKLTISTNGVWTGSGALGRIPAPAGGFPFVAREGSVLFNGGSNFVNGELVVGGVVVDAGPGQNAKITIEHGSTLNLSSWFSLGRGNGVGGVSSDLVLTNSATLIAGNLSAGFNGGAPTNFPKGSITMSSNSTFTITANGAVNFAESLGSDFTWTLNNSAQFIALGTGGKHLGQNGKSTINLNGSSSMLLGNAVTYIGRSPTTTAFSTGVVNMASSGIFSVANDLRVGGSQDNGASRGSFGQFNISSGTVNLSSLTVGRGNNNQNQCIGEVVVNGGNLTCTNDLILGFAGTNAYGRLTINGGTVNVATTVRKWLHVGRFDFVDGVVDMNGGILNLNTSTSIRFNTSSTVAGPKGGNTFNQNGGTINFYTDYGITPGGDTEAAVCLVEGGNAASVNTYNLNGGTLNAPYVFSRNSNGSRTFNFNGGTLRAVPSTQSPVVLMNLGTGSALVQVRNGGAIIDSNGSDRSIADSLQHSTIGGDNVIDGGLTKLGAGTLTLSVAPSYTGPTIVNAGTLASPAGGAFSGGITVANGSLSIPSTVTGGGSLSVSNGALVLDVVTGNSLNVGSVSLQNSTTITLNYGSLAGNPTVPAINAGSLAAPGNPVNLVVNGVGFTTGTFTLIDYTGAALPNLANFTLTLAPGLGAVLVNNTANSSIDLNVSTAPQNLTWHGTTANWDINNTLNWNGGASKYLEYGSGVTTVGDAVRFDDSLFNDFITPQNTNVVLTTALSAFPVLVDSTLPYIFTGAGYLTNSVSVVKSNTGTLTLATANGHTGGTLVYGGSVVITNENALGVVASKLTLAGGGLQVNANATNTTRNINVPAASTLGVVASSTYQVGGVINGAGSLNKTDTGTLLITGSNGLTGSLNVDQGIVRNIGNQTLPAVVRVGNLSGFDGVLNISGGNFRADNNAGQFNSGLIAGSAATSAGSISLSGGNLTVRQQLGLGAGAGGYGAFNMTGGTLNNGSYIVVGFNNDRASYNQTAGTVTLSSNLMTIAAGGTGSRAVANISGGTFNTTFALSSGIMVGERGVGVLNVSGSAVINAPTNAGVTVGPVGSQAGWDGQLNLNGGTVTAFRVVKGPGTGVAKLSLNGGTVKASTGNANFMSGMDSAVVYPGGAIIDDGGFNITVPQLLSKPSDYGVSSISVASGGSGYIDAPIVTISGGSGSNATAIATVSGGVVTGITVTCPGTGYSNGDVLSVSFEGGGAAASSAVANSPVLGLLTSGGLVKRGSGTLNLTGANTYTGSNAVTAGTMLITPLHQVVGQPVGVASNATFGVLANVAGAATVGNVTLGNTASDRHGLSFVVATGSNPTSPVLQCGTLTLNGTNTVRLSGTVSAGIIPLVQYTGALAGSGVFNSSIGGLAQGVVGVVSNYVAGSTLYAVVSGTAGVVWTGTNSVASATNVWTINGITNWLAAGLPTFYMETNAPGDPVIFNDVGSGVVLVSNTVSPASVTINNTTKNYTFSGPGKISGTTGLSKQGAGTATMSLANDYSGATTVNQGVLQLGTATAIPDGNTAAGVSVAAAGTLDLNGFSETINGLSGSGLINNSSATGPTLTVGNGNGGGNWAGTINNSGAGAVTLLKVGTGSLTVSGTNFLGGTSQFNGGTNYLTGAIQALGAGEFWIQQNAGNSTLIVDGGSLVVSNWFVVGRNNVGAVGTLIVNSGLVQKAGANNFVVGSLNAQGSLIINGGQVLNNGNLWLGENASANAVLRLNGGLVQATQVRPNNTVASSTAYFNGGTLQASGSSADFISGSTACWIQSGGLVLDTQGFGLTNAAILNEDGTSPGGGLVKLGSGVLALTAANTFSGATTVSNGTLYVDGSLAGTVTVRSGGTLGGVGSIAGLVTVQSGGKLTAGASIGTLTLAATPILGGSVVAKIDPNLGTPIADQIVVSGLPLNYGGTLVITNVGADLAAGMTFKLFEASSYSGSFSIVSQTPNQIVTWNTANLAVNGTITVASVTPAVNLTPVPITFGTTGSTLNLSWPPDHLGWTLQSNSVSVVNAATWYPIAGSTTVTNLSLTLDPSKSNVFFRLFIPQ